MLGAVLTRGRAALPYPLPAGGGDFMRKLL